MENTVDLLQIKIDKAREELPEESRQAIDAIDWKNIIINMRVEKGYSFTQIEDLEIETELLLCGLLSPEQYPKELEKRMGLPKAQVDVLVNEMNEKIFSKIRQELIKIIDKKETSENKQTAEEPIEDLSMPETTLENGKPVESREELLKNIENPTKTPSILVQRLSGAFKTEPVDTDHSLNKLRSSTPSSPSSSEKRAMGSSIDPYRETPE